MFITEAGFKRLIKEAYKSNTLIVGERGSSLYICGGYWAIEVWREVLGKKKLAALIELTGELPGDGRCYRAGKMGNQYEITENAYFQVAHNADVCTELVNITKIILRSEPIYARVIQIPNTTELYLVNEKIIDILSLAVMDETEDRPVGPKVGPIEGIYWNSNYMAFCVLPWDGKGSEDILAHLSKITLETDEMALWG